MGDYTCCDRYDNCSNQICHCYTPFPLERITAFLLCLNFIVVSMCRCFVFAALLRKVFAFIISACYNMGTKGNEAMISVIGTYKKPGVAAPGFLFWAGCGYKYLSCYTCHNRYKKGNENFCHIIPPFCRRESQPFYYA